MSGVGRRRSEVEIANLFRSKDALRPFEPLSSARLERLTARLASASALWSQGDRRLREAGFADALEELENAVTPEGLEELLERIDSARLDSLEGLPPLEGASAARGDLFCHWPGRSLATGEAEIASRGFFDDRDRPPLVLWLDVIARPAARRDSAFESAVLAWVPFDRLDAARAGRAACPNGALAFVAEISRPLASQLGPLLENGLEGAALPLRSGVRS